MELDAKQTAVPIEIAVTGTAALLCKFVEDNAEFLLGTLRLYIRRAGLAVFDELQDSAIELMNEVLIESLEHAERFDTARQPMAWLLGIAANLIKRKKVEMAKRGRVMLAGDLCGRETGDLSEAEVFDRLAQLAVDSAAHEFEANEAADRMLALVSADDRQILQLAVIKQMDGQALARALGTSPGAARVRLHRAIERLRAALNQQKNKQGDEIHE